MSKPAAFMGVYTDLKFLSGLKVARITLEIPIERSEEFIGMFGAPNKADPAWCAIARMTTGAYAPEGNGSAGREPEPLATSTTAPDRAGATHAETAKTQDKPRTYTRSQKAALKCHDKDFQLWLAVKYAAIFDRHFYAHADNDQASPDACDLTLKEALGITSKRELDTDGHKAAAWDALITDFELRDVVRS